MKQTTLNSGLLANSWYGDTTGKTQNVLDISCVSANGMNTILVNNAPAIVLSSTGARDTITGYNVGYNANWTVTGQGNGAYCTIQEYTSSPTQDFMINGDFFLLFAITLYILCFAL